MHPARILAVALVSAVAIVQARDAVACGGCFHDPNETASVVTDHRMILTISKTRRRATIRSATKVTRPRSRGFSRFAEP